LFTRAPPFPLLVRRLIQADKVMSIVLYPKPIVVGGGGFDEDGWPSTLLPMTSLANEYHGNNDAYIVYKKFD